MIENMATVLSDSPLLTVGFPIQFAAVKAEEVEPSIDRLLEIVKERLTTLSGEDVPRTYLDIILALDTATEPLDFAMAIVRHLEAVATTPELRAAHNAVQEPVSVFYTSIALNEKLWSAVKAVDQSVDKATLAPVDRRFLKKTVTGFRRAGADLDAAGKTKLEELDVALTKATTKFSENVLDATNAFERIITDWAQLAGLPESAVEAARESAKSKGREGWRLTLQAPS
jgi:oligopeptidase A